MLHPRRPILPGGPLLTVLACCMAVVGCATNGTQDAPRGVDDALTHSEGSRRDVPSRSSHMYIAGTNGLEVREIVIRSTEAELGEALGPWLAAINDDQRLSGHAHRNGIRWARVPREEFDALIESFARVDQNRMNWMGQQHQWTEIIRRQISPPRGAPREAQGEAVVVDGRVRRLASGRMVMLLRGWTIMTEDGPRIYTEIAWEYYRTASGGGQRTVDLFGREGRPEGERFDSVTARMNLERQWVYVLTGASPASDWSVHDRPGGPSEGLEAEDESAAIGRNNADRPDEVARRGGQPPGGGAVGPHAALPATLGELAFAGDDSRQRVLIALIPHIPDEIYPPETGDGNEVDE